MTNFEIIPPDRAGLSTEEAAKRLREEGRNEFGTREGRSLISILREVLAEPMFALLLGAGIIYLALGSVHEALLLLMLACVSVIITVVQEYRSEKVLKALRDMTAPRALVVRDGQTVRVPGSEVVRGDLMHVAEGDRIAADAVLVQSHDLLLDESILTGEAFPVDKMVLADPHDPRCHLFAGTLAVRGAGQAVVIKTGTRSAIGAIGQSLQKLEIEAPKLQRQVRRIVRVFGGLAIVACLAAFGLFWINSGQVLEAILAGIALGMALLPEEFPLVLTVFMVMGAWRLSRARVLTRRPSAIETLGSATVLCTDKTGTLTENRMQIVAAANLHEAWDRHNPSSPPAWVKEIAQVGSLASRPHSLDPMDKAFHALLKDHGQEVADLHQNYDALKEFGLRPELLATTTILKFNGDGQERIFSKGAPEAVISLCDLNADQQAALTKQIEQFAAQGLRVLAVASGVCADGMLPAEHAACKLNFLGLVGFLDPVRPSVPQAVKECYTAGIRIIMITGDYPVTAGAIARQAGLREPEKILSGADSAVLSDEELRQAIQHVTVFARIMPEQKLRIVEALKANGEIVAMTGDGVNDAPSLKAAHIGVAMGGQGNRRRARGIVDCSA